MVDAATQERALNDLEVALSLIPENEKMDYLQALQKCPKLLSTESNSLIFLRFTNYNAPAAAISLTLYWKTRKDAFGDKAFLPFTLTNRGALDEDDVAAIRGAVSFTPLTDDFGRTLVFYDISRRRALKTSRKYLFFLHQYAMENVMSQIEGYVMVIILWENFILASGSYQILQDYKTIFPMKVKAMHIISRKARITRNRIENLLLKTYSNVFSMYNLVFHEITSHEEIVKCMEPHGVKSSSVPLWFGGTWSYWGVHEWIKVHQSKSLELHGDFSPEFQEAECVSLGAHPNHHLPLKKRAKIASVVSDYELRKNPSLEPNVEAISNLSIGVSLTCSQKQALQSALFNWEASLAVKNYKGMISLDPDLINFLCCALISALQDLGEAESQAFVKASSVASNSIWAEESNPFLFILCEDFHLNHAAKRLARYWTFRRDIFGGNWCLLLHQTGEGALKRHSDLSILDTGFVNLLPHDDRDCSVVFIDTDRLGELTDCHKRCLFYMFSIATENRKSQRDGINIILRLSDCSSALVESIVDYISQAMPSFPLRFKAIHVLTSVVSAQLDNFRKDVGRIVYIHEIASATLAWKILGQFDLKRESLPVCVGGNWGFGDFNLWQEIRTRVEWNIPLGLVGSTRMNMPGMKAYTVINDKRERHRRMNAVHSWRKRARYKFEKADLEDKCIDLMREQNGLRDTEAMLSQLLDAARSLLAEND